MAQLLAGRYRLDAAVGRGPHGVVWRAQNVGTRQTLAVKVLHSDFADDPFVVDRITRESTVLTAFLHPAYVRFREVHAKVGEVALVMELVEGVDVRRTIAVSGPLTPTAAVEIAAACAEMIAAGHRAGVVHCDIKPSNIIVMDGTGQPRITDCRLARLVRGHRAEEDQFADPRYAAPEVVLGGPPTPATDVFGLGLVLYEMVTGVPRVSGDASVDSQRPFATSAGKQLRDVIEACLVADPALRPTAEAMAADLRDLTLRHPAIAPAQVAPNKRAVVAFREPALRPGPTGGRRRRLATVSVAAAIAGLAAAAAIAGGLPWAPTDQARHSDRPSDGGRPSGSSAGAEPRLPDMANEQSSDGAVAFATYWFDTLEYAGTTGDTRPLAAASSPACAECEAAIRSLRDAHPDGGTTRGGDYTVRSVHIDSFFDIRRPVLRVVYDRTPRTTIDADGQVVAVLPGVTFASCQLILEPDGARWRVLENQSSIPVA